MKTEDELLMSEVYLDAESEIQEQLEDMREYGHNIISMILRRVARKEGDVCANLLIRELNLSSIGIQEVK